MSQPQQPYVPTELGEQPVGKLLAGYALPAIVAMVAVILAMAVTPQLAVQLYASLVSIGVAGAAWGIVRSRRRRAPQSFQN